MRITKKKITAVAAGAAVIALGAGSAFAYWTAGGSAEGSATVASGPSAVTVKMIFDPSATLAPGATVNITDFQATNPNNYDVTLEKFGNVQLTATGGCDTSWFRLVTGGYDLPLPYTGPAAPLAPAVAVPANAVDASVSFPSLVQLVFDNKPVNQDSCKGQTLTLTADFVEA